MSVGIIGLGGIGLAIASHLSRARIRMVVSNSRGPDTLAPLVRQLGKTASAGTAAEAAAQDIVVVSVQWRQLQAALSGLPAWGGRIVVDPTNPLGAPDFRPADLGGRTSSEVVADLVPGARLVKAFNTLRPEVLAADPHQGGGRRVIFYSGDDRDAKKEVGRLIDTLGFAGIDLGDLRRGGAMQQFPGGPLPALDLIRLG